MRRRRNRSGWWAWSEPSTARQVAGWGSMVISGRAPASADEGTRTSGSVTIGSCSRSGVVGTSVHRPSLLGLCSLAPGRSVACQVVHPNGDRTDLRLAHSYSADQLAWFRQGSALATLSFRARTLARSDGAMPGDRGCAVLVEQLCCGPIDDGRAVCPF